MGNLLQNAQAGWKQANWVDRTFIVIFIAAAIGSAILVMLVIEAAAGTKAHIFLLVLGAGVAVSFIGWWLVKRGPLGVTATASAGLLLASGVTWMTFMEAGFFGGEIAAPQFAIPAVNSDADARAFAAQPLTRASLINYATSLGYDEVTHGQADRNILDSLGTRGVVAPAEGMHNTERDLLREGRVLWQVRVTNSPAHTGRGYPLIGLSPGRNWIFAYGYTPIDRLPPDMEEFLASRHRHSDDPPGTRVVGVARSLVVAEASDSVRVGGFIVIKQHFGYWWNRPMARFTGPGDHHLWGNCDTHGCCEM